MNALVEQILEYYFSKMREPTLDELQIGDELVLKEPGCGFVTLYLNGEVHGSAGNIKEIFPSLAEELRANTMQALTGDTRFGPVSMDDSKKLKYRVDRITHRKIIAQKDVEELDPTTKGVIAIARSYDTLAVILPNMSPKLMTGSDFLPVLQKKLNTDNIDEKDYIFYEIDTEVQTNY